jgi:cytochrome c553
MNTITKTDALAALRACEGDVTQARLREVGLTCHQAVALGRVLDSLDATIKRGRGGLRSLVVSVDEAIERIEALHVDILEEPAAIRTACVVCHDPHGVYEIGDTFPLRYLRRLTRMTSTYPDINGLEVAYDDDLYRIYRGHLYRLDAGEMVEAAL